MTGPKLNEKSFVAGERAGTKASAKYVHMSAWKVRVVLDLIRDLPVRQADEVLQFTDREAAVAVRKESSVDNTSWFDSPDTPPTLADSRALPCLSRYGCLSTRTTCDATWANVACA